jgi:hypothetical protein
MTSPAHSEPDLVNLASDAEDPDSEPEVELLPPPPPENFRPPEGNPRGR